jgi:hypothetical protein
MKQKIVSKYPRLKLEREFITTVMENINYVRRNPTYFAPVMDDKEFIIRATDLLRNKYLELFILLKDDFKNDRNLVIKYLEKNGHILKHIPDHFKDDDLIVKAAIKNQGYAIKYASERFKKNRDLVLLALKNNGHALEALSDEFKDDEELVIIAIQSDGRTIEYASERLKNNKEIVLNAVGNNGNAIQFVSLELKADKEVALTAIKNSTKDDILNYLDISIKHDKELCLAAYKRNKHSIKFFSQELHDELQGKDVIPYLEALILKESLESELSSQNQKNKKLKL